MMQTTGEQGEEVTVDEAVVRDLGARRGLLAIPHPVACELGLNDGLQEGPGQVGFVEKGWKELADASTVQTELNYEGPYVEDTLDPVAEQDREPRQGRVRARRSRKSAVPDLDREIPKGAVRERTLLFQRELADILACIFAEAQAAGTLDALVRSGSQSTEDLGE